MTDAPHRSVPLASSRIGVHGPLRPRGSRSTTLAFTASCPSRNTVAVTSKASPTTALAGRRPESTSGLTSRTGMRPITVSLSVVFRAAVLRGALRAAPVLLLVLVLVLVLALLLVRALAVVLPVLAVLRAARLRAVAGRPSRASGSRSGAGCSGRATPAARGLGIAGSVCPAVAARLSESVRSADSASVASSVSATGVDWSRVSPCMPNSCPRSAAAPAGRSGARGVPGELLGGVRSRR